MRKFAFAVAVLTMPVACGVLAIGFTNPPSWSGAAYLVGLMLVVVGGLTAPYRATRWRGIARSGLTLIALTAAVRIALGSDGSHVRERVVAHGRGGSRWLNRVVDEADLSLGAARLLCATGLIPRSEARDLVAATRGAYRRMREAEGTVPSPFVSTYFERQSPETFDAIFMRPARSDPDVAVIFLHGFAGNFTLPCWQFAQAALDAGIATVCPSTGWRGDWWSAAGRRTVLRTIDLLRGEGVDRIYLAGLSNGGVGASRLAPALGPQLAGLILISGADPRAAVAGVPVLVVQGTGDTMMPRAGGRAYARRAGRQATTPFKVLPPLKSSRNPSIAVRFALLALGWAGTWGHGTSGKPLEV